jgi:uncharacterized protein YndB with AHSA1/START domain
MTDQVLDAVRRSVTVALAPERAFELFTDRMGEWWPHAGSHSLTEEYTTVHLEPRGGGRWYERTEDGRETDFGRVLDWDPPGRVLLAWMLNPQWTYSEDPYSEVEVTFVPDGEGGTRVELVHRGFERYAEGGEEMRAAVGSDGGWTQLLELYAAAAR